MTEARDVASVEAADAGCAVAAAEAVAEVANKGKEITQLTSQIEVFVFYLRFKPVYLLWICL